MRNLRDIIPKIVGQILVNKTLNCLGIEITEGISKVKGSLEELNEVVIGLMVAGARPVRKRHSDQDYSSPPSSSEEAAEGRYC